jgi:hypothetical protein
MITNKTFCWMVVECLFLYYYRNRGAPGVQSFVERQLLALEAVVQTRPDLVLLVAYDTPSPSQALFDRVAVAVGLLQERAALEPVAGGVGILLAAAGADSRLEGLEALDAAVALVRQRWLARKAALDTTPPIYMRPHTTLQPQAGERPPASQETGALAALKDKLVQEVALQQAALSTDDKAAAERLEKGKAEKFVVVTREKVKKNRDVKEIWSASTIQTLDAEKSLDFFLEKQSYPDKKPKNKEREAWTNIEVAPEKEISRDISHKPIDLTEANKLN